MFHPVCWHPPFLHPSYLDVDLVLPSLSMATHSQEKAAVVVDISKVESIEMAAVASGGVPPLGPSTIDASIGGAADGEKSPTGDRMATAPDEIGAGGSKAVIPEGTGGKSERPVDASPTTQRTEFIPKQRTNCLNDHRALFCFTLENPVRRALIALINSKGYFIVTILIILLNCVVLSLDMPAYVQPSWLRLTTTYLEYGFTAFFLIEMLCKIIAMGLVLHPNAYLRVPWNVFDALVALVSVVSLFASSVSALSALRAFRILRPLRTITTIKRLRSLLSALFEAVPHVAVISFLIFCFLCMSSLTMLQYCGGGTKNRRCYVAAPSDINRSWYVYPPQTNDADLIEGSRVVRTSSASSTVLSGAQWFNMLERTSAIDLPERYTAVRWPNSSFASSSSTALPAPFASIVFPPAADPNSYVVMLLGKNTSITNSDDALSNDAASAQAASLVRFHTAFMAARVAVSASREVLRNAALAFYGLNQTSAQRSYNLSAASVSATAAATAAVAFLDEADSPFLRGQPTQDDGTASAVLPEGGWPTPLPLLDYSTVTVNSLFLRSARRGVASVLVDGGTSCPSATTDGDSAASSSAVTPVDLTRNTTDLLVATAVANAAVTTSLIALRSVEVIFQRVLVDAIIAFMSKFYETTLKTSPSLDDCTSDGFFVKKYWTRLNVVGTSSQLQALDNGELVDRVASSGTNRSTTATTPLLSFPRSQLDGRLSSWNRDGRRAVLVPVGTIGVEPDAYRLAARDYQHWMSYLRDEWWPFDPSAASAAGGREETIAAAVNFSGFLLKRSSEDAAAGSATNPAFGSLALAKQLATPTFVPLETNSPATTGCGGFLVCPTGTTCSAPRNPGEVDMSPLTYDTMPQALLAMLKVFTVDNWPDEMKVTVNTCGSLSLVMFISVSLLGGFVMVNVFLGVLMTEYGKTANFSDKDEAERQTRKLSMFERRLTLVQLRRQRNQSSSDLMSPSRSRNDGDDGDQGDGASRTEGAPSDGGGGNDHPGGLPFSSGADDGGTDGEMGTKETTRKGKKKKATRRRRASSIVGLNRSVGRSNGTGGGGVDPSALRRLSLSGSEFLNSSTALTGGSSFLLNHASTKKPSTLLKRRSDLVAATTPMAQKGGPTGGSRRFSQIPVIQPQDCDLSDEGNDEEDEVKQTKDAAAVSALMHHQYSLSILAAAKPSGGVSPNSRNNGGGAAAGSVKKPAALLQPSASLVLQPGALFSPSEVQRISPNKSNNLQPQNSVSFPSAPLNQSLSSSAYLVTPSNKANAVLRRQLSLQASRSFLPGLGKSQRLGGGRGAGGGINGMMSSSIGQFDERVMGSDSSDDDDDDDGGGGSSSSSSTRSPSHLRKTTSTIRPSPKSAAAIASLGKSFRVGEEAAPGRLAQSVRPTSSGALGGRKAIAATKKKKTAVVVDAFDRFASSSSSSSSSSSTSSVSSTTTSDDASAATASAARAKGRRLSGALGRSVVRMPPPAAAVRRPQRRASEIAARLAAANSGHWASDTTTPKRPTTFAGGASSTVVDAAGNTASKRRQSDVEGDQKLNATSSSMEVESLSGTTGEVAELGSTAAKNNSSTAAVTAPSAPTATSNDSNHPSGGGPADGRMNAGPLVVVDPATLEQSFNPFMSAIFSPMDASTVADDSGKRMDDASQQLTKPPQPFSEGALDDVGSSGNELMTVTSSSFFPAARGAAGKTRRGSHHQLAAYGNCRLQMQHISRQADIPMLVITFINLLALMMDHYGIPPLWDFTLTCISWACTCLFAVDFLWKIVAYGPVNAVIVDKFTIMDGLLLVLSAVEFFFIGTTSLSALRAFRVVRLFRALRALRLARRVRTLYVLAAGLQPAIVPALSVLGLIFVVVFIYALLGMQFFGDVHYARQLVLQQERATKAQLRRTATATQLADVLNRSSPTSAASFGASPSIYGYYYDPDYNPAYRLSFGTVWDAMLSCFIVLTGENWHDAMIDMYRIAGPYFTLPFFISLFFIGNYVMVNLFGAVVIESLEKAMVKARDDNFDEDIAEFAEEKKYPPRLVLPSVSVVCKNMRQSINLTRTTSDARLRGIGAAASTGSSSGNAKLDRAPPVALATSSPLPSASAGFSPKSASKYRLTNQSDGEALLSAAPRPDSSDSNGVSPRPPIAKPPATLETHLFHFAEALDQPLSFGLGTEVSSSVVQHEGWILQGRAFFVFGPGNCLRRAIASLVLSIGWDVLSGLITLVNLAYVAIASPFAGRAANALDPYAWYVNVGCVGFYAFECLLKCIAQGVFLPLKEAHCFPDGSDLGGLNERRDGMVYAYFSSMSNVANVLVTIHGILGIYFPFLRVADAIRAIRLIALIPSLRLTTLAVAETLPGVVQALMLCLVFWSIFAVFGMQLWMGAWYRCSDPSIFTEAECANSGTFPELRRDGSVDSFVNHTSTYVHTVRRWEPYNTNFDNFPNAMFSLFVVAIGEQWTVVMYRGIDATDQGTGPVHGNNPWVALYFVGFVIVGNFFTLNIVMGVLVTFFLREKRKHDGTMMLTHDQRMFLFTRKTLQASMFGYDPGPPKNILRRFCYNMVNATPMSLCSDAEVGAMGGAAEGRTAEEEKKQKRRRKEAAMTAKYIVTLDTPLLELLVFLFMLGALTRLCVKGYTFSDLANSWLELIHFSAIMMLIFDFAVKVVGYSAGYILIPQNQIDFVLLCVILLSYFSTSAAFLHPVVMILRAVRFATLLKRNENAQKLVAMFIHGARNFVTVIMLLSTILFMFASIGVQLFSGAALGGPLGGLSHFRSIESALLVLYQVLTTESWLDVAAQCAVPTPTCAACQPAVAYAFFTFFVVLSFLIVLQLTAVVIVEHLDDIDLSGDTHMIAAFSEVKRLWLEVTRSTSMSISVDKLMWLLSRVPKRITRLHVGATWRGIFQLVSSLHIELHKDLKIRYEPVVQALLLHAFNIETTSVRSHMTDLLASVSDPNVFTVAHVIAVRTIWAHWRCFQKEKRHRRREVRREQREKRRQQLSGGGLIDAGEGDEDNDDVISSTTSDSDDSGVIEVWMDEDLR